MAKKRMEVPVINEMELISLIAGGSQVVAEQKVEPVPDVEISPKNEPEKKNRPASENSEPVTLKTESEPVQRKKKNILEDYVDTYLKRKNLKDRKYAFIREEYHQKISRLIHLLGVDGLSVGGYVDNVLEQHFKTFGEEIGRLYKNELEKLG
jgi:hypothetical protein